jgi:hypothetical protein
MIRVNLHEVGHVIPPTATDGRGSNGVPAGFILHSAQANNCPVSGCKEIE